MAGQLRDVSENVMSMSFYLKKKCHVLSKAFTGSSTTGIAAIRHNRRFIGIDSNTQYLELSVKRLKEELENIANNPKPTAELV